MTCITHLFDIVLQRHDIVCLQKTDRLGCIYSFLHYWIT